MTGVYAISGFVISTYFDNALISIKDIVWRMRQNEADWVLRHLDRAGREA
jgi:hypothetical protein